MSSFINNLVARNLDLIDSVQPRPVSMFEPQSLAGIPIDHSHPFSRVVRGDELADSQNDSNWEAVQAEPKKPSVPTPSESASILPSESNQQLHGNPITKTEWRNHSGIHSNTLENDTPPLGRYNIATLPLSDEDLPPISEMRKSEKPEAASENHRAMASRSIENSETNKSDHKVAGHSQMTNDLLTPQGSPSELNQQSLGQPTTKTELRNHTGIGSNLQNSNASPLERHNLATFSVSEEELPPKFGGKKSRSPKTPVEENWATAPRPIDAFETISEKEHFKGFPDKKSEKSSEKPINISNNELFKQTNIEEQDRSIPAPLLQEIAIEKAASLDTPGYRAGKKFKFGMKPGPAARKLTEKSAAKQEPTTSQPSMPRATQTKVLIKPQVTKIKEASVLTSFEPKEPQKTPPTIQVTIGRVDVRATQAKSPNRHRSTRSRQG